MEGAHYQVRNGVRYPDGFVDFFRALAELSPPDSFLVLGSGAWDRETQDALSKLAVDPGAGLPIPAGFHSDRGVVPITASNMETLAGLADHHASPEIAIHLAAVTADDSWLEWFDATDDPISMSLTLPESAVERFAARVRGDWMACRWLDPVNPT